MGHTQQTLSHGMQSHKNGHVVQSSTHSRIGKHHLMGMMFQINYTFNRDSISSFFLIRHLAVLCILLSYCSPKLKSDSS